MPKTYIITVIFTVSYLWACQNSEQSDQPASSPLQGRWSGTITGGDPHFEENVSATLLLDQYYEQITGTITTAEGAFQSDSLINGRFVDNQLTFDAIQSEIYPGAEITFSGQHQDSTITGIWQHGKLHNGEWQVTKVPSSQRKIKND